MFRRRMRHAAARMLPAGVDDKDMREIGGTVPCCRVKLLIEELEQPWSAALAVGSDCFRNS